MSPFREDLPRSAAGPYNPWLIAVIISIATFMEILDTTVANVSLVHIAGSLAISQDESTWILTSYLVSNAIVLPVSGWLSNVIGRKRFYMLSVAIFALGSGLAATATSLGFMIVARVIQGIGGGGLAPTEQSMLADTFPPAKRAQVFALYGLTVVLAPAIGPVLGGWITDHLSWHWIFLINLPVGALSLSLTATFVTEPPALIEERRRLFERGFSVDYLGFALVAIGFGSLQVVFDKFARDDGFSSPFIITFAAIAFAALFFLVFWELEHSHPAVNFRLFSHRSFAIANTVMFLFGFIIISTTQLLPQMTQDLFGYNSLTAGMTLAGGGVCTLLLMPVAGILTGRLVQPKWLLLLGLIDSGLALLYLSHFDLAVSFNQIALGRVFQASALPFLFIPITAAGYIGLPPDRGNEASALFNLMRNLGGSAGVSFVTTMLIWRSQFHQERLAEHITPYANLAGNTLAGWAQEVARQAAIMSYLDVFRLLAWAAFAMVPLALFLGNISKGSAAHGH